MSSQTVALGNGQSINIARPEGMDDKTWSEVTKYLQGNPAMALSMQSAIKDVTTNPAKMAEFKEMVNAVQNFSANQTDLINKLKADPLLQAKFAEMEKGGLQTILKYYNDEGFLRMISQKAGGAPMGLTDAIKAGNVASVQQQLASGVNPNVTDATGISALHYAVGCNRPEVMKLLMEKGANVFCVDPKNNTLLHYAAGYGHADATEYLLKIGLNVNQINADGQTPMALATKNGHPSTITALKAAGGHM